MYPQYSRVPSEPFVLHLTKKEQARITDILSRGKSPAREQTRARILDLLHRKEPASQIAVVLSVSVATIYNIRAKYLSKGLEMTLHDKARPGRPATITELDKTRIRALAALPAPDGRSAWTLRLLAEKAVELGVIDSISHNEVRKILHGG